MFGDKLFDCYYGQRAGIPKKPAPDGFLMAMEHFGVAPADTIIFEDSPEGIQAAQASGAPYLLVREIR